MTINFPKQTKRRSYLFLFFLILAVLVVILIWQGYLIKIKIKAPLVLPPAPLPKIEINYEILESPILKDLQSFEEIKPFEGQAGRENPFIPY